MGCFSWLRADKTTRQINFVAGDTIKMLIPKEFGGGYFKGKYDGYGRITDKNGESCDIYEVVAFWNIDSLKTDSFPKISKFTDDNRSIGIRIACYDHQQEELEFPIKLVSASYKGTYEDCKDFSENDPSQGFVRLTENSIKKWR